jgi:hypothetical protein
VHLRLLVVASLLVPLLPVRWLTAQEDVADITSQELRADKGQNKRYFLVGSPRTSGHRRKAALHFFFLFRTTKNPPPSWCRGTWEVPPGRSPARAF